MENNKNRIYQKFQEQVKTFLDGYTERLITELEKTKVITKLSGTEDGEIFYKLNANEILEQSSKGPIKRDIFKQLFEFRNIIRQVYYSLKFPDSNRTSDFTLIQLITKLEEQGALIAPWKDHSEVISIMNKMDSLVTNNQEITNGIEKTINQSRINLSNITLNLLEYYGVHKAEVYFSEFGYKKIIENDSSNHPDLILIHEKSIYPQLVFEFKYRKKTALPGKELILKTLKEIEGLDKKENGNLYYFLVIFTDQGINDFERIKFQLNQTLKESAKYLYNSNKLKFVPIEVNHLHLIEDTFKDFKETYIEQDIRFVFKNQSPPKNRLDRNDHFFERPFAFKKCDFEILINPKDSKFWRFGFQFSSGTFPPLEEDRHANNEIPDIHITVGDLETTNNLPRWDRSNLLDLVSYHAPSISSGFKSLNNYNGQPVFLSVKSNNDGSSVNFEIKIDGKSIGQKSFDLNNYNYCRIHAWCDYEHFQLETDLKIILKGN